MVRVVSFYAIPKPIPKLKQCLSRNAVHGLGFKIRSVSQPVIKSDYYSCVKST